LENGLDVDSLHDCGAPFIKDGHIGGNAEAETQQSGDYSFEKMGRTIKNSRSETKSSTVLNMR
jgi:hypothetical protein